MKTKLNLLLVVAVGMSMSGCGAGKKLVKELNFFQESVQGEQYAGFDAKLNLGSIQLPRATLPLQNGLGEVLMGGDEVRLKVNITEAVNFPIGDGTTLPNGKAIPVTLPQGAVPIGIPILGSNSKVYLSVSKTQIMAGVAISLKSDLGSIGDILGIPMNVFFPFNIANDLTGSAGIYTGDKFGIGVFAVKTLGAAQSMSTFASASNVTGSFKPKTQTPSNSKLRKLNRAISEIRRVSLD